MRKLILPLLSLLVMYMGSASLGMAQFADRAKFYGGFSYNIVTLEPVGSTQKFPFFYYGLSAGMNYVLLHSNDVVSLGINPNAVVSFQLDPMYGASFLGQAPVFLLARLGANATPYNEQKFGIGAGIGANYSFLTKKLSDSGNNTVRINQGFLNPSAVVEATINARGWNYVLRFNWSLAKPTHDIRIGVDKFPFRFGVGGLGINYNF